LIGFSLLVFGDKIGDSPKIKKQNMIYFTGSLPLVSGFYIINYEREVVTGDRGSLNLAAGYGGFSNMGVAGNASIVSANYISGVKKHHFEADLGISFHKNTAPNTNLETFPYVNAGYRIQKRGKPSLFRFGVGFPMILYTSIGFAF
jgi:hypothetical protein